MLVFKCNIYFSPQKEKRTAFYSDFNRFCLVYLFIYWCLSGVIYGYRGNIPHSHAAKTYFFYSGAESWEWTFCFCFNSLRFQNPLADGWMAFGNVDYWQLKVMIGILHQSVEIVLTQIWHLQRKSNQQRPWINQANLITKHTRYNKINYEKRKP